MATSAQNDRVRPWLYLLLAAAVCGVVGLELSRSTRMQKLQEENLALRAQVADLEGVHGRNAELEQSRNEALRSWDSHASELLALRDEVARHRARTNEFSSLRAGLYNATLRAERLEQEVLGLRSKLAATKPAPPRLGAWVGVSIRNARPRQLDAPPPGGVEVMHIVAYSPAAKSALQSGDRIVAVDGEPIADESDFKRLLSQKAGGEKLAFDVARKDELLRVSVEPTDWPQ